MNLNDNKLGWHLLKVLAIALKERYPEILFGEELSSEEKFYLDVDLKEKISEGNLDLLAARIKELLQGGLIFRLVEVKDLDFEDQPFKKRLIEIFKEEGKTVFGLVIEDKQGRRLLSDIANKEIEDGSLSLNLNNFVLNEISGAFFLGDRGNKQLIRISGLIRGTEDLLKDSLQLIEDRKINDHKNIGKRQNIFLNSQLFGQGFPAWLEDGMLIKNKVSEVVRKLERKFNFEEVSTPIFGHKSLYELSGHLSHYRESMFPTIKLEDEELILRPMTCPHHLILFSKRRWSYRELPKRYCESSRLFRYEASGALSGLERVRAMELTEGHIFLRVDQISSEIKRCFKMINEAIETFGIKIDHVALSTRSKDGEGFHGSNLLWDESQKLLEDTIKELGVEYRIDEGGAAFYGPKIDIQIKNFLGKELTLSTIQLDYYLPERFQAKYTNRDGIEEDCVLIHRGLLGTYERFISILLEQYSGNLPLWINPRQIMIIPTTIKSQPILDYCEEIYKKLRDMGVNTNINLSEGYLKKKILLAQKDRFKLTVVIGNKELETKTISVRNYGEDRTETIELTKFFKLLRVDDPTIKEITVKNE